MSQGQDKVLLSKGTQYWPVELAEKLLADPLSWGPSVYDPFSGSYVDDLAEQCDDFAKLASCVDGAYDRHGDESWEWAQTIEDKIKAGTSYEAYSTQDLLDIVFLDLRKERFSDGYIRASEPFLRKIIQEVVKRARSATPPVFIQQSVEKAK